MEEGLNWLTAGESAHECKRMVDRIKEVSRRTTRESRWLWYSTPDAVLPVHIASALHPKVRSKYL